ncbi:MAG: ribulose-phosphate 3-epimerase, partial [Bacilli bacterium]|nr:ribulose-phosphate 3-epimerase [Bacilli bacterium]
GGQDFIMSSVDKINYLNVLREENNYNFVIEVDGGINDKTIKHCKNADIVVVGSYITNGNDYQIQINKLK